MQYEITITKWLAEKKGIAEHFRGEKEGETELAKLISIYNDGENEIQVWIPKSQILEEEIYIEPTPKGITSRSPF